MWSNRKKGKNKIGQVRKREKEKGKINKREKEEKMKRNKK